MFHVYVTNNVDFDVYFLAQNALEAFFGFLYYAGSPGAPCRSGGAEFYEISLQADVSNAEFLAFS